MSDVRPLSAALVIIVEEYEDDLTVDSNDGKRLEKAERVAEQKVAAKRKKLQDEEARKEPRLGGGSTACGGFNVVPSHKAYFRWWRACPKAAWAYCLLPVQ